MSENERVYLTPEGFQKLKEELEYLRTVRRPQVAQHIHDAKADGDISENAGYDEAKNEQAFVEGRILTLENMLQRAVVIQEGQHRDVVDLGCRVTVRDTDADELETYHIVGSAEVDPLNGKISNVSPIGRALMGRRVGDRVSVQTPGGVIHLEIIDIA
ncbi:MAG: transcription elongation factor GreA [Anaerolineae bacterium]